jgi:hypothetical protein
LIVVVNRHYDGRTGLIRRVTEIGEIAGLEGKVVQMGKIYKWDPKTDEISRTKYPILLTEKIADKCRLTKNQVNMEILKRKLVLEAMLRKGVRGEKDVIGVFQEYHKNPETVLSKFGIREKIPSNTPHPD